MIVNLESAIKYENKEAIIVFALLKLMPVKRGRGFDCLGTPAILTLMTLVASCKGQLFPVFQQSWDFFKDPCLIPPGT